MPDERQDDLQQVLGGGAAGVGVACGDSGGGACEEVGELDGRILLGGRGRVVCPADPRGSSTPSPRRARPCG